MKKQWLSQTDTLRPVQTPQETASVGRPVHAIEALQNVAGNRVVSHLLHSANLHHQEHNLSASNSSVLQAKPLFRGLSHELLENQPPNSEALSQAASLATQHSEPATGLPDTLKAGIEDASGLSMADVKVHYNSSQPAQLLALAYTQGTDIHIGPGQEKHLAHEAWHVVQQKQGRVKPMMQANGVAINDHRGLEQEADAISRKVSQLPVSSQAQQRPSQRSGSLKLLTPAQPNAPVQMVKFDREDLTKRLEYLENDSSVNLDPRTLQEMLQDIFGNNIEVDTKDLSPLAYRLLLTFLEEVGLMNSLVKAKDEPPQQKNDFQAYDFDNLQNYGVLEKLQDQTDNFTGAVTQTLPTLAEFADYESDSDTRFENNPFNNSYGGFADYDSDADNKPVTSPESDDEGGLPIPTEDAIVFALEREAQREQEMQIAKKLREEEEARKRQEEAEKQEKEKYRPLSDPTLLGEEKTLSGKEKTLLGKFLGRYREELLSEQVLAENAAYGASKRLNSPLVQENPGQRPSKRVNFNFMDQNMVRFLVAFNSARRYHGTTAQNARQIKRTGLQPGRRGGKGGAEWNQAKEWLMKQGVKPTDLMIWRRVVQTGKNRDRQGVYTTALRQEAMKYPQGVSQDKKRLLRIFQSPEEVNAIKPDFEYDEDVRTTRPDVGYTPTVIPPSNILFGAFSELKPQDQDFLYGIIRQHWPGDPKPSLSDLRELHKEAIEKGYLTD